MEKVQKNDFHNLEPSPAGFKTVQMFFFNLVCA